MPFTTFHFGPALAAKSINPSKFTLITFAFTQVMIDLEPLYWIYQEAGHLHRWLHSFPGAIVVTAAGVFLGKPIGKWFLTEWHKIPNRPFSRYLSFPTSISWLAAFIGAFFGAFSHVILDALYHSDLQPFQPFSEGNIFQGLVHFQTIYGFCLGSGALGIAVFFFHWFRWFKG